ncbi:hypothetical protein Pla22_35370 [Rubripirellula amarantea]|uniref:VWFA domain-containing protein n=1 Tax=Rubripirellula amarantea TaxID=2527999 RepID=A0A5C5WIY8_9BACT|nr:hypothetical protein [Rubripirellula amarantea]TWT50794.1 hypothetical protein Pla22_35370 [Rubripirellula amarantea]
MMASLRFAGDLPTPLVLSIAVIASLAVMFYYLRETKHLDPPLSYALPGLRAAAVLLAILILAGPVWHRTITVGTLGRVVFAVDSSKSMSLTDTTDLKQSGHRMQRALSLLSGDGEKSGWLEALSSTHQVEVVAFDFGSPTILYGGSDQRDENISSIASDGELRLSTVAIPDGEATSLASPLSSSLASLDENEATTGQSGNEAESDKDDEGATRAAVVLLSDGRGNTGVSPVDIAERLRVVGAQVHAVGFGSQDDLPDVGVTRVDRPENVASDGILAGRVHFNQFSMNGRPIEVRIEDALGNVLWRETIDADAVGQQSIPFRLPVESVLENLVEDTPRGVNRSTVVMDLKAVVATVGGGSDDSIPQNNAMSFRVSASTRDRQLLLIDGSSRWETRYLRNLFDRDPSWSIDTIIYGPGTDTARLPRGSRPGQFPIKAEDLARYDAVILGEVPANDFEIFDAELLKTFVSRGGGLVVIDGRYDQLRQLTQSRLSELIPVQYQSKDLVRVNSIAPTAMGVDQPMLSLINDQSALVDYWKRLPHPDATAMVKAQPDAEVWASAMGVTGEELPWLVTRLYGSGRVFYLGAGQTWRWRYKVADQVHAKFWNQLMLAVMQPPYSASDDYASIGTDKIEYAPSESAVIRARLQGTAGEPIGDATVDALLVSGNQIIATVPMSIDDANRGTYRAETVGLSPGEYEVRLRASGFDAKALQASAPIWVGNDHSAEWIRTSLSEQSLREITTAGGGEYVHETSAEQILERLKPLSSGQIIDSDVLVWQSFYWFWAIMALLAMEWYFRKRSGLV